ncbi:hypothetical protein FQN54_000576 [Arachnomyces sp. PD_36]|nr:hypothetical protein FQN54_000576 [Arachnomyces sp. PD_36]
MMGKSFEVPAQSEASSNESSTETSLVSVSKNDKSEYQTHDFILDKRKAPASKKAGGISISPCLLDPLVQDLSSSSRYYLSHFASKLTRDLVSHDVPDHNPYPNSAIYLSNTFSDPLNAATDSTLSLTLGSPGGEPHSRNELSAKTLRDALTAKQKALQFLRQALDNVETVDREVVLTTILLSINFELVASGNDEWKVHVEGARKLIDHFQLPSGTPGSPMGQLRDYATADCLIYYVLGSAFLLRNSRANTAHHSPNVLPMLERSEVNSYMSCPAVLLQVVLSASHLSDQQGSVISEEEDQDPIDNEVEEASRLMEKAQSFDVHAWSARVQGISSHNDFESRLHIALAHKSAVCLYINRAVPSAKLLNYYSIQALVQNIIDNLSSILPGDPLLKGTCWPTFMAGAESESPELQKWVVTRIYVLWEILPWGYLRNTLGILRMIWGLKDNPDPLTRGSDGWLQKMKALGKEWIVV